MLVVGTTALSPIVASGMRTFSSHVNMWNPGRRFSPKKSIDSKNPREIARESRHWLLQDGFKTDVGMHWTDSSKARHCVLKGDFPCEPFHFLSKSNEDDGCVLANHQVTGTMR